MQQQINTIYTISIVLLILAFLFLALFIFFFLRFFIFDKKKRGSKKAQEDFDIFEERREELKKKEKENRKEKTPSYAYPSYEKSAYEEDNTVPMAYSKKQKKEPEIDGTMPLRSKDVGPLKSSASPYEDGTIPLKTRNGDDTVPLSVHKEQMRYEDTMPMQGFYGSSKKDVPLDETLPMEEEEEFDGEDFWAENTVMLDTLDEQETQMLKGSKREEGFEIKEDIVITHGRKHQR